MISRKQPLKPVKTPRPIRNVIDNVVHSLGISRNFHGWQVVNKWPEIVGENIAKKARAFRYENGTLLVAVPDAAWRHNLLMETEEILEKIHSMPYGKCIKQIRLVHREKGTDRNGNQG